MNSKKIKNIVLLSSVLLVSSFAFTTTSCESKNNTDTYSYNLFTDDGVNIATILETNGKSINEDLAYSVSSSNKEVAYTLSNGDIIANKVGTTIIEVNDAKNNSLYKVNLTVTESPKVAQELSYVHSKATLQYALEDVVLSERNLAKHRKYQIGVKVPNQTDQTLTVLSSNEDVITTIEENGNYYLYTQNVGQSNISIYDCALNKMVEYTINVVKKMESDEEVREFLTRTDYFQGWGWDSGNIHGGDDVAMKISFPTNSSGILYGNSGELGNVGQNTFEISYVQYGMVSDGNGNYTGYDETFRYQILNFQSAIQFPYTLQYLDVSETKDVLRLYSTNILIDFFFPKSN